MNESGRYIQRLQDEANEKFRQLERPAHEELMAFIKEQQEHYMQQAVLIYGYMALPWYVRAKCAIRHFFSSIFCKPKRFKFEVDYALGKNAIKEYFKEAK